jgi:(4S)-4-hydroxy-5-phosphonooxypentane-2,3-dione isomerase
MMPKPNFAVAVTFEIKPDCIDLFRARVCRQAADSVEKEPDCFQFDVLVDEVDPNVVHLYETYRDEAAFTFHRSTPHFLDFNATVQDWVASKHVRRLNFIQERSK